MIRRFLQFLHDCYYGIPLGGMARASDWAWWRKQHIKKNCEMCGKKGTLLKSLELHHCRPFHTAPDKEKDPDNVITLCRPCHFDHGHLTDFKSWNEHIREDAKAFREKVANRPYLTGNRI